MRYALLACLALVAPMFAAPAFAGDVERLELARRFVATRSEATEMRFFDATLPYYLSAIEQTVNITDLERARLPDLLREEYRAALVTAREHTAETYARLFTEDELRELVGFYESGVGRRYLEHQGEIQQDSIDLQRAMNAAVLQNAAERMLEERGAQHF
ncbi:MAG: DUF2059 domain-containing protein [Alphaproteobacteria bacterium]|nr:DUF2059 domain-containing protein [Alphaproteobacteria bacterium]